MGYGVADTGVDFEFITPTEAHALLKSDKAIFVDSRDTDDFKISKIQTSYSFPANDMMFKQDKLDKSLLPRCKELSAKGKMVIIVSDAGISGQANRGHVSRCRHVAQYLHELGVDRDSIRRLQGGLNSWKKSGLDGILGDRRCYYAGSLMTGEQEAKVTAAALADAAAAAIENGGEAPAAIEPAMAAMSLADAPADAPAEGAEATAVVAVPAAREEVAPPPVVVTAPTVYRVIKGGDIYKKASPEAEKIIKLDWPVDRLVRTTGQVHVGASGGKWAELDTAAGEKRGWVYVEGPGFGPSSRKIISEYLAY